MIACRARLVNVFSDPLKGFSGKGSTRNYFELILKLGLPTQKKTSLISTELPAVLQPRRASQLPSAGKIHSGPFHHHGSSRSWRTTEKAIGFPTSPSQVLHFLIQQAIALLTDVTKIYSLGGGEAHKGKKTQLFLCANFMESRSSVCPTCSCTAEVQRKPPRPSSPQLGAVEHLESICAIC